MLRAFGGLELSDEQREQVRAVFESHAEEFRALREEARGGALTREQLRERTRELEDSVRAGIEPILTPDQLDVLDERRARIETRREAAEQHRVEARIRAEAAREAMIEVLELTEEQVVALDSLRGAPVGETAPRTRSERRMGQREALASVLTARQHEIVTLHRAIVGSKVRCGHGPRRAPSS